MHSEFFEDVNEAKEREEADVDNDEDAAGGSGTGDDPNELLISEEHRQRTPASDIGAASDTAGAGATSAAPPNA